MGFSPHKFGRYVIIDPVAVGGMAEIYRARLAASNKEGSKEGPDRIIIIKKVIANLSQNTEFVQMFEEEIKITVGLTHPNIVQIYDYGNVDSQLFMAMEYVEGKNLRQFINRLTEMKSMFSIDMSSYIISQTCHALAYAHSYKDRVSGKHLQIVHRDISPQNVMISYDGAVKLFDFGIAKAKSASDSTRAGVIKGKPSYLAPEQITGEELDGRCDVFALGICLWELLTAKRLFVAENDLAILRMIQSAKIEPPSTFNPAIPQALDAIVLKALTRDREKRYQSAEEFQRDLHKFLYSFNPSFNPADLSYYAQELFKKEIKEDRERLQKYVAIEPIDNGSSEEVDESKPASKKKRKESTKLAEGLMSAADFNRETMENAVGSDSRASGLSNDSVVIDINESGSQKQGTFLNRPANLPGVKKGEAGVIPPWSKPGANTASTMIRKGTRTTVALNQSKSSLSASMGLVATFAILLGGVYFVHSQGIMEIPLLSPYIGSPPVAQNSPEPDRSTQGAVAGQANAGRDLAGAVKTTPDLPQNGSGAILRLASNADGYSLSINGMTANVVGSQVVIPIKQKVILRAYKPCYAPIAHELELQDAQTSVLTLDFKPSPCGELWVTTVPAGIVKIYGENMDPIELQTPFKDALKLPVGKYRLIAEERVKIFNITKEIEVEIENGKRTNALDIPLQ